MKIKTLLLLVTFGWCGLTSAQFGAFERSQIVGTSNILARGTITLGSETRSNWPTVGTTGITSNYPSGLVITSIVDGVVQGVMAAPSSGTFDHTALSNLSWTASGHTSTPARIAGFLEGGSAGVIGIGAGLELDGSDNLNVSNAVLSGAAAGATAWQNPASATDWAWSSDGAQITLTGYTGANAVVIPDMLDGLPVTTIGVSCFADNTSITSVTANQQLTTLGGWAFNGCYSLTSLSLLGVKSVGEAAFGGCTNLTSISLPAITSFDANAFYGCPALTNVTFSGNAPTVGSGIYGESPNVTNYVTNPTATGWGSTLGGQPVVRMEVAGATSVTLSNSTSVTWTNLGSGVWQATALSDASKVTTNANFDKLAIGDGGGIWSNLNAGALTGSLSQATLFIGTNGFGELVANGISNAAPVAAFNGNFVLTPANDRVFGLFGISSSGWTNWFTMGDYNHSFKIISAVGDSRPQDILTAYRGLIIRNGGYDTIAGAGTNTLTLQYRSTNAATDPTIQRWETATNTDPTNTTYELVAKLLTNGTFWAKGLDITGNGTITGNFTVTGTLNGTSTNTSAVGGVGLAGLVQSNLSVEVIANNVTNTGTYNPSTGKVLVNTGTFSGMDVQDYFLFGGTTDTTVGNLNWGYGGSGTPSYLGGGTLTNSFRFQTSATTSNAAYVYTKCLGGAANLNGSSVEASIKVATTNDMRISLGTKSSVSAALTGGQYLYFSSAIGTNNWYLSRNGSLTDTGVAVLPDTWYHCRTEQVGTNYTVAINGTQVLTATNGTWLSHSQWMFIVENLGSQAATNYIGYFRLRIPSYKPWGLP
jgi:hypothetical protein